MFLIYCTFYTNTDILLCLVGLFKYTLMLPRSYMVRLHVLNIMWFFSDFWNGFWNPPTEVKVLHWNPHVRDSETMKSVKRGVIWFFSFFFFAESDSVCDFTIRKTYNMIYIHTWSKVKIFDDFDPPCWFFICRRILMILFFSVLLIMSSFHNI